jgi:hypothetical protein
MPMTSTKSAKTVRPKNKRQPELTEAEQRELLERENQARERRAETQLELAKLFLAKDQPKIALRRLKAIVAEYGGSAAANEANRLIKRLGH